MKRKKPDDTGGDDNNNNKEQKKKINEDVNTDNNNIHNHALHYYYYSEDIYNGLRAKENNQTTKPTYMPDQPTVNQQMRSILIDWLIDVHNQFCRIPETLYLTVNIIDRFLSRNIISKPRLQLAGISSFLIATKFIEVWQPKIHHLVYICDDTYSKLEVMDMENAILNRLDWKIPCCPNAFTFARIYFEIGRASKEARRVAHYVLDVTLTSYNLLTYLPSELAAASLMIAFRNTGKESDWNETLTDYTRYERTELLPVACAIVDHILGTKNELKAATTKHGYKRYGRVSRINIVYP